MTAPLGSAALVKAKRDELAADNRGSLVRFLVGLLPLAVAFAVYLVVFQEMRPGATGDEPHYLVTASSIAYDLDVDLRNNYASEEQVLRIVNVFPLGPHAFVYKESGELRPLRGVGLPAVLAPGVALGGLTGARLMMILIAALLAGQLYRLLRDLGIPGLYRVPAWAAAVFCLPVLPFTSQIYPELAGALLVVVALRVMASRALRPWALVLGASAAAALPWLHVRYLPLSLAIVVGLAIAACARGWTPDRPARGVKATASAARGFSVHSASVLTKRWRTVTLPIIGAYVIGLGLLAIAYQRWYGSPNFQAAYAPYGSPAVGTGRWDFWYHFALRDFLDPIVGWIPFAPVHWLGLAALGCLVLRFGWPAAGCVAGVFGYLLVVESVGPGSGFGFPGRYLMIVIPLIALPLAVAIQKLRPARVIFVGLLAVSLVFAAAAVREWGRLYPSDAQRIFGIRSIATAFPVLNEIQIPASFVLPPNGPPRPATGHLEAGLAVARAGRDQPGFLRHGPYAGLGAGAYVATFTLAASGAGPDEEVANIEVVGAPSSVLASAVVTGRQLRANRLTDLKLPFANPGNFLIETRIFYRGNGILRAGRIHVGPIAPPQPATRFPDWPLAFLWVAGTFLIGWLFVDVMRSRNGRRRPASSA